MKAETFSCPASRRSTRIPLRFAPLLTTLVLTAIPCGTALAQTTGFTKTGGTVAYGDTANWVNGEVNGVFHSSLTLSNDLTLTFSGDTTLETGLIFEHGGSRPVVLRANGTGPGTLTLGGDIVVNMASNSQSVTFGGTGTNQLNVDLGGETRTLLVTGSSNSARVLTFANELSNGGIVVTGGGKVNLKNATNSLDSVTVAGADFVVDGSGNSGVNTKMIVDDALTIGPGGASETGVGASVVTLKTAAGQNTTLEASRLVRGAGTAVFFRGTNLGGAPFGSADTANVHFIDAAPVLSGTGTSGSTIGIIAGAYGDTSATGNGFGATGGLVTYDADTGVRVLTASEYVTTITSGQTELENIRLANSSGAGTTFTLGENTAINSLSLVVSGAADSGITLDGAGVLTLHSGVIYASASSPASTATSAMIVKNSINLNGQEGIVLFNTVAGSGGTGGANLQLSGAITNDGGKGLTFNGAGPVELNGTTANTYTGVTTVNGGYVRFNKTGAGANAAIGGDLVVNGGTVLWGTSNQIADSANITVNGGIAMLRPANNSGSSVSETFNNLNVNGGEFQTGSSGTGSSTVELNNANVAGGSLTVNRNNKVTLSGVMNLTGGTVSVNRAQGTTGIVETLLNLNGGLSIANTASGAYTAITFIPGESATNMGGRIVLGGDLTFTGNSTNANTVLISGPTGTSDRAGTIALNGSRTFNIGDGAAESDLTIEAPLVDATSGTSSGIVKTGLGTLDLRGANTYTGATVVNAGTLLLNGSSASAVTVNSGGRLGGTGASSESVTINDGGVLAPGLGEGGLSVADLALTGTNAVLALEIGGTEAGTYSQLNVSGGVNFDGNGVIQLSLSDFAPTADDLFFVVLNNGENAISGTLFGLEQGATFSSAGFLWQISYLGNFATGEFTGGNDLVLAVVPEPQTWALLGIVALAFSAARRKGQRA